MVSHTVTKFRFPVDQIQRISVMFPDSIGSFNNMKRTYSILFSVTKKKVQQIFIQDLLQRGLRTKNTDFVVEKIMRHTKSEAFRSEKNIMELSRSLMLVVLNDATADLEETDRMARKKLDSLIKYAKKNLIVNSFKLFKEEFFEILRSYREVLWAERRSKNNRAVCFKYKKARNLRPPDLEDNHEVPLNHNSYDAIQVILPDDHPEELKGFMNSHTLQKIGIRFGSSRSERAETQIPNVFGQININEDEKEALKLHPKMRLFEKLKLRDIELETEKGLAKVRWREKPIQVQRNQDQDSLTHNNLPFQCGPGVGPISDKNSLYFPSIRVTDLPTNRYVKLPDPLDSTEETKLLSFKTEMMETTKKYIDQNCKSDGAQSWNISSQQRIGLTNLKRRIQEEDLVAMESDKSKRMTLMTKRNYIESTDPHTSGDLVISLEDQHHLERSLNGHTLQLARVFLVCFNQGDLARVKKALINEDIEPTPLRAVRKDHKQVPAHLQEFGPPSRPIGDGNNAPDSQLSWIMANICQKAADSLFSETECTSTEDMLSAIDKANEAPVRLSNQVCVSLDAVWLYPSLQKEETSSVCAEMVVNSGIYFEAIN